MPICAALTGAEGAPGTLPVTVTDLGQTVLEPDGKLTFKVVLTNQTEQDVAAEVEFTVQQDPALYSKTAPRSLYGENIAAGTKSWFELEGKVIEDSTMTDGKPWTDFGGPFNNREKWAEAFTYVDLGKNVRIVHLGHVGGDPNRMYKADFAASPDGKTYQRVEGLQSVEFHRQWGPQEIQVPKPFETRFLRIRWHNAGERVEAFRQPAELFVYGGESEALWAFPQTGPKLLDGKLNRTIPAKAAETIELGDGRPLSSGAYFVAVRTKAGGRTQMNFGRIFVMPPVLDQVSSNSRFGMNGIEFAKLGRRQGYGWVRFENLKWPMVSVEPGVYSFDGSLPPHQKYDEIFRTYKENGLSIMPYLFLTPKYLAPPGAKNNGVTHPPTDLSKYGEFVFQAVARYGSKKHPSDALLTKDKVSGLGYIDLYELWNEADLNDPNWGSWRGVFTDYYIMFRYGAEAVKKADPDAKVANGGWSGMGVPLMESMRTYKYPDGKCPLDFMDVLSVHYYSFQVPPEMAKVNDNSYRNGAPLHNLNFEQELDALMAWRDRHKPAMPVWITETGYDTGGHKGVDERLQACWLPRDLMIILAAGVEKVFVFREKGSGDSLFSASGVVRDDGSLKPSWFTFATLLRQLDGVTQKPIKMTFEDGNVRAYLWKRDGKPIVSAWAIQGTARLDLPPGRCTITDAFGTSMAKDLTAPLELTEFPVYLTDFSAPTAHAWEERASKLAEQEKQRVERQSKLEAYLFEFGTKDRGATMIVGNERTFTDVVAADLYDEAKGYGFEPNKGVQDKEAKWLRPPWAVKMAPDARFTFNAKPGDYELHVCIRAGAEGTFVVRGIEGGDQTVKLSSSRDGEAVTVTVKVGAKPVTIESHFNGELVWLTMIQTDAGQR
jgi:hypothetical protein